MQFIKLSDVDVVITERGWRKEHRPHGKAETFRYCDADAFVSGLRCPCAALYVRELGEGLHPRAAATPEGSAP